MASANSASVMTVPNLESIKKKIYYDARSGMSVALKELLTDSSLDASTIKDVLSQLVEEDGQKCTPLIIAARNGHDKAVRVLLQFNPDLEQEGTVKFDGYAIEGASALWCAAGAGNLTVVKILVRAGAKVNHTTRTNSTPVRAACFDGRLDIVKYLTDHDADIHITNKYNNTCLMIAAYKGHLDVVNFLLELKANPNEKAHCGATALHFAAECGHDEIVITLLQHGAAIVRNEHGMTPLIAAAERGCSKVVEYFLTINEVTEREKIDALELLGASHASDKDNYNLVKAAEYLERAMLRRYADPDNIIMKELQPPQAPYNNHQESTSLQELRAVLLSPASLHMEALAIRERILGPHNPEVPPAIIFRGAVFADSSRFDRCLQLWMHAMKLKLDINVCVVKDLLRFSQVFSQMVHIGADLDYRVVLEVLDSAVLELKCNHSKITNPGPKDDVEAIKEELEQNMISSLYLIMIAQRIIKSSASSSQSHNDTKNNNNNNNNNAGLAWGDLVGNGEGVVLENFPLRAAETHLLRLRHEREEKDEDESHRASVSEKEMRLYTAIYRLLRTNSLTCRGQTLLHLAVSPETHVDDFYTNLVCKFPCASTARLLISCGANVNALDNARNSPLHLIVPYQKPISDFLTIYNIIQGLVEAGAHMDIVNSAGLTPMDCASTAVAEMILRLQQRLSLQCLAARALVNAGVPFKGRVPRALEAFVELHGPSKPLRTTPHSPMQQ
ncbi:protein fem-1 homolog B isoform X2 [Hyalella azteca]|uniref:Protein fem-1 homolog B n=1 Tax=Hyalella azteca TaxID=294128 RepID=A0A979FVP4_HYAAZ|nr:protein fem-1 homolog B isoform X2 [Hyalella azteca]